jgi:hypothetical protein
LVLAYANAESSPFSFAVWGTLGCAQVLLLSVLLEDGLRRRFSTAHLLARCEGAVLAAGVAMAVRVITTPWRAEAGEPPPTLTELALGSLVLTHTVFALWALLAVFPYAASEATARRAEAEQFRLDVELTQLRNRLRPHFVLNTLNAIAGLVRDEPEQARTLIAHLGELLTREVEGARDLEPFGEQVAWLKCYAELLAARYRGRLRFEWSFGPEAEHAWVPAFLLQPLVENAACHGALQRRGGGTVRVFAWLDPTESLFRMVVEDDGPCRRVARRGVGLSSVELCLALCWPGATFRLERSGGHTRAVVEGPAIASAAAGRSLAPRCEAA